MNIYIFNYLEGTFFFTHSWQTVWNIKLCNGGCTVYISNSVGLHYLQGSPQVTNVKDQYFCVIYIITRKLGVIFILNLQEISSASCYDGTLLSFISIHHDNQIHVRVLLLHCAVTPGALNFIISILRKSDIHQQPTNFKLCYSSKQ